MGCQRFFLYCGIQIVHILSLLEGIKERNSLAEERNGVIN